MQCVRLREQCAGLIQVPAQHQRLRQDRHRDAHAHRFFNVERTLVGQHLAQHGSGVTRSVVARQGIGVVAFDRQQHRVRALLAEGGAGQHQRRLDHAQRLGETSEMNTGVRPARTRVQRILARLAKVVRGNGHRLGQRRHRRSLAAAFGVNVGQASQRIDPQRRLRRLHAAKVVHQVRQQGLRHRQIARRVGGFSQPPSAVQTEPVRGAERARAALHHPGQPVQAGAHFTQLVEAGTNQHAQFGRHFGLPGQVGLDPARCCVQQVGCGDGTAAPGTRHRLGEDRRDEALHLFGSFQRGAGVFGLQQRAVALPQRQGRTCGQSHQHQHLRVSTAQRGHRQRQRNSGLDLVTAHPAPDMVAT